MPFLDDLYDDVDGTLLADHDPDVGDVGSWEEMGFSTGGGGTVGADTLIQSNVLTTNDVNAQGATHRNSTDPGSDEYDIEARWAFADLAQANRFHWVCARMTPSGTSDSAVDRYMFLGNGAAEEWQLYKIVGGVFSTLGTAPAAGMPAGTFDIRVEVRAGSLACFVDDVEVVTSTDTDITQRGRVGVGIARGGSRGHEAHRVTGTAVGAVHTVTASIGLALAVDPVTVARHRVGVSMPMALGVGASTSHPGKGRPRPVRPSASPRPGRPFAGLRPIRGRSASRPSRPYFTSD